MQICLSLFIFFFFLHPERENGSGGPQTLGPSHCMEVTEEVKYSSNMERSHPTGRAVFQNKGHSIIVELKNGGGKTSTLKDP